MALYPLQTPAQLSAHLRSLRRSLGLTQAQLGATLGLDQTRIAKIEANPGAISVEQLLKVLSALGIQVALQSHDKVADPAATRSVDW